MRKEAFLSHEEHLRINEERDHDNFEMTVVSVFESPFYPKGASHNEAIRLMQKTFEERHAASPFIAAASSVSHEQGRYEWLAAVNRCVRAVLSFASAEGVTAHEVKTYITKALTDDPKIKEENAKNLNHRRLQRLVNRALACQVVMGEAVQVAQPAKRSARWRAVNALEQLAKVGGLPDAPGEAG